ncbi:MAG: AMP-binding protein, partial [Pseudomonadota bacterium]
MAAQTNAATTTPNPLRGPMRGLTLQQAADHVVTTDPTFALSEATIRGVTYPVFANTPKTVPEMMLAVREVHGDGTDDYVVFNHERMTFDGFTGTVHHMAAALRDKCGVARGTRVGIAMRNLPEMLVLMMAVSSAGGVIVFLNGWWTTEELDYALRDSEAQLVFA